MTLGREPFGYVVAVEGASVRLNLRDAHRGQVAAHPDGVSTVTEIGGLFAIDGGGRLLVLRVRSLSFAEPREAHTKGVGSTSAKGEPLRHLDATVVGTISRNTGELLFTPDSLVSPALGAEAYPLSAEHLACVLSSESGDDQTISLGRDLRGGGELRCGLSQLLGRHVAVLGSTGQGKSCFTAAAIQQMLKMPSARIIVFDINGEYEQALKCHVPADRYKHTVLGGPGVDNKIPYYALGRHGLARLLLPSEKTQRPALAFALDALNRVEWDASAAGARLVGAAAAALFDDGRAGNATPAWQAIETLRRGAGNKAAVWPNMLALSALIAESHAIKPGRNGGHERDTFAYGNVSSLVTRLRRCVDDPLFTDVVDVMGGAPSGSGLLSWKAEGRALCERFFGGPNVAWNLHVVDLRKVAHDLMPLVLGSLLELLAVELFRRGPGQSYPTLLVLEEAHHYLRQVAEGGDEHSALAYERLAKEGRKFGLGIWLSTQRPSEVSSTVLSQCGTWAVFRLASDQDIRAVGAAAEWIDRQELTRISGLPRQQAVVFGASVNMPVRVFAPTANPRPKSADPDYRRWTKPLVDPFNAALVAPDECHEVKADERAKR